MIRVFLDANVYFSASRSAHGGSAVIIKLAEQKKILSYATREVLLEAERNLRQKEPPNTIMVFYQLIDKIKPAQVNIDKKQAESRFTRIVNRKDSYVLEGARKSKVSYLVTLDKKHLLSIKDKIKDFQIVTPAELIEILAKM